MGSGPTRAARPAVTAGLITVALLIVMAGSGPARADTVDGGGGGYAAFTLSGSAGAYTGTMQLPGGFPAATFTSTSLGGAAVVSGASTYLNPSTPPGARYGLSRNQQYVNLRPAANNPRSPSTTTYTFGTPTPSSGWMFTLGDVDADRVVVTATDPAGDPVPTASLGFQSVFNYCGGTPSPCTRTTPPDLPTWLPSSSELTGNTAATDTNGAAGWFEPTTALSTLTLTYYQRSGFPVYQTWFATRTHDITGAVTGCTGAGVPVTLSDEQGNVVATTQTASDGTYAFTGYTAATYVVSLDVPTGCTTGTGQITVDTDQGSSTADFTLETVPPSPTPTATDTSTTSPTATVAPTVTATPTATASASASMTPSPSGTASVDATAAATDTRPAVPTVIDAGLPGSPRSGPHSGPGPTPGGRLPWLVTAGLGVACLAAGAALLLAGRRVRRP